MPAKKPVPSNKTKQVKKTTAQAKSVNAKTSGLAVASLILAFFIPFIGLILGIIALITIKKNGEKGRGLAITAVVISSIIMLTIVAAGATVYKIVSDNININNGNSISIKTKNGSSLSIGNSVKLPSGFPSDVPIYKPSEIKAAANDKKDTYGITLVANANFSTVDSYYNTQLQNQGWQADPNNTGYSYDKSKLASYTKGGKTLGIVMTSNSQNTQTNIVITVSPTPNTASTE